MGTRGWPILTLLACAALTHCAAQAPAGPVVDGSGTSNFLPLLLRVLENLKVRAKPTPTLSYRSIGTGPGQFELTSAPPSVQYACGGGQAIDNAAVVNIPVVISTVAIYVNLNGLQTGQLSLSPCTLAKIFNGELKTWSAVPFENGRSFNLTDQPIIPIYHAAGSSSTLALTQYLAGACPDTWGAGKTGLVMSDLVTVATQYNNATQGAVGTTEDMIDALATVSGAIGYAEPGQAMTAGLTEVMIQAAPPSNLWKHYAMLGSSTPVASPGFITDNPAGWGTSDLILKGNNWPMAVVNYVHVPKDLTTAGSAGSLVVQIAKAFFSKEVIDLMPSYQLRPAFGAVDDAARGKILSTIDTLVTIQPGSAWSTDEVTTWVPGFANKSLTISGLRQDYLLNSVTELYTTTDRTRSVIRQGGTYQLHGGGAFQSANYMRTLMATLQSQARAPIHATYRDVGTVQAQNEIVDVATSIPNLNNFKVGDVPLSKDKWGSLNTCNEAGCPPGVLHLPFAIGSVSIFFNQQLPSQYLGLTSCLASGIFKGSINRWDDATLNGVTNINNGFAKGDGSESFIRQPITAFVYADLSSANMILKAWLATCSGDANAGTWAADMVALPTTANVVSKYNFTDPVTGSTRPRDITTPQDMADAISSTPHSIGFLPSNLGISRGLDEASLLNVGGNEEYIRTKDVLLTGTNPAKRDLREVFQALITAQGLDTRDTAADWSDVNFISGDAAAGAGGYPLTTLLYIYVYQDLSGFGDSGPLTKALFQYMYSDAGQQMLAEAGLTPLPSKLVVHCQQQLTRLKFAPLLAEWAFETADKITNAGMGLQTFSEVRESAEQALVTALLNNVNQLQGQLSSGVVVRGAGPKSANLDLIRGMMDDLTAFASYPVRFVFEEVPDNNMDRITSLLKLNRSDASGSQVGFLVLDQPLTPAQKNDLPGVIMQSPLMVRPLALLYNAGVNSTVPPLKMSACTVAGIMNGAIKNWNDPAIAADNPGVTLPENLILLRGGYSTNNPAGATTSGSIKAVIDYVTATCPTQSVTFANQAVIASDDVYAEVAASQLKPFSVLAIGDPTWVDAASGIMDIALPNIAVNPKVAALSGNFSRANESSAAAYSDCLLMKVVPNTEEYKLVLDDWSGISLAGSCAAAAGITGVPDGGFDPQTIPSSEVYPLMRLDFLVMPADLQSYSYAGGAMKGMIHYMFDSDQWQAKTLSLAVPTAAPLPEQQLGRSRDMLVLVETAEGTPEWPVVSSSLDNAVPLTATDRPFITSFAKPIYLATGVDGAGGGGAVSAAAARQAAQEFLAANQARYTSTVESKDSSQARTLAIVALAICLVLSLCGLLIALLALRDARRALANSYRPGSLAQVLPATQGMQMMAQMNANPPALHPAAAALASPSGRRAKGAVLNPSYSYNSKTAPRKPASNGGSGRFNLSGCLGGSGAQDDRYQGFMENQHTAPSDPSTATPSPDIKIQMRPVV